MSLVALGVLSVYLLVHTVTNQPIGQETDEGLAAHLFQLLMVGQLPVILYFMVRWIPQRPRLASLVLLMQTAVWVLAWVPIYFLEH